jgi:hypothetical protein
MKVNVGQTNLEKCKVIKRKASSRHRSVPATNTAG